MPYPEIARLGVNPELEVNGYGIPGLCWHLALDRQKFPTDDIEVRKAIIHAIDVDEILKVAYHGVQRRGYGPLRSANFGYDPSVKTDFPYPYDPEKAKELLEAAGYVPGPDSIRVKDGQRMDFVYHTKAWVQYTKDICIVVQSQLREVGIDVDCVPLEPGTYVSENQARHGNTVLTQSTLSDPGLVLEIMFHSKNLDAFNWSFTDNEKLDEVLDAAARELDLEKRAELLHQAQWLILGDAAIVPVVDDFVFFGWNKRVKGLRINLIGHPDFYDAFLED